MGKKYYWLKLKDDFFRDKKIKKLRRIAGGDTYTIIYLKMQLLSLSNDGILVFEGVEDSFAEEIALEIDEEVENVKVTIAFLISNGLLEETEQDHYVMIETLKCIGTESESAERVRRMRAKKKLLGEPKVDEKRYGGNGLKALERDKYKCVRCGSPENICIHHNNGLSNELEDLITLCRKCHSKVEQEVKSVTCNGEVTECNTEIDIEKEKELEKREEIEIREDIYSPAKAEPHIPYKEIIEYLNSRIGTNYKHTTNKTRDLIKARFNEGFTLEDFKEVIDKKSMEWINTDMKKYLRPETLFGTKFESYLNQDVKERKLTTKDIQDKIDFSDF